MGLSSALRGAAGAQRAAIERRVRAMVRSLVLLVIVALLLVSGLVFVMMGVYHSLSETLPHWQAGGLVALGALAGALLLLAIASAAGPRRKPRPGPSADRDAAEVGTEFASAAREFLGEHRPSGVDLTIAAFVVGLMSSRRTRRRRDPD